MAKGGRDPGGAHRRNSAGAVGSRLEARSTGIDLRLCASSMAGGGFPPPKRGGPRLSLGIK